MINKAHQHNFETLLRAADNGDLCLLECTDWATGKPVMAVCAVQQDADGSVAFVPIAKLFDGNPYEEIAPPSTDELKEITDAIDN